jgi:ABC-type transport system involved in cytochrome bd biosynthesis fused ATPase/permease subunit
MSIAQNRTTSLLRVSGYWLIAMSIIHGLGAISYYFEPWSDIVRSGVFNAVSRWVDLNVG